jgi:hypothetical protein
VSKSNKRDPMPVTLFRFILIACKLFVIQDYYIETRQDYREIPSNPFGLYLISMPAGNLTGIMAKR